MRETQKARDARRRRLDGEKLGKRAEPVIEVALGEYERCAVAMFGCDSCGFKGYITFEEIAKHRARCAVPVLNHCPGCDEYGASHTTPSIEHPAVPAQEAPREQREIWCTCKHTIWVHGPEGCGSLGCKCEQFDPRLAEPQAGAQPGCPGCQFVNRNHLYSCPARQRVKPQAGAQPDEEPRSASPFYGNSECAKCKTHLYGKRTYSIPSGIPPARMIVCSACAYPPTEPQAGAQTEITGPCEFHSENSWGVCRVCAQRKAGAQVPSQDEIGSILVAAIDRHITDESLRDLAVIAANGIYWRNQRIGKLEAHLNSIKSYATEAAKTPITRESIQAAESLEAVPIRPRMEPATQGCGAIYLVSEVKAYIERVEARISRLEAAQTGLKFTALSQYDEMQGLCRLVLSEIGGSK